jgi:hypothetical protein
MATATPTAPAGTRERAVRVGIALLGAASLATGIWMVLSPSTFFDALGPFGEQNSHYLRDMATWQIAFGAALLVAAGRPSWRRPLIAVGAGQALLHTLNHILDAGDADPAWVGVFDIVTLAATLGLFAWLWSASAEADR